jgi:class 3 adenylate cyclase/tetratricopeptide (TPR) repeat protein
VSRSDQQATLDELLDRAVAAINRGDRADSDALAGQVLAVDRTNSDAEELLAAPVDHGEIRRLTIMFADLVDSTELSTRIEPEIYRTVVGRYRDEVVRLVAHYDGHLASTKGDGLLAVFGHPNAHEDDVWRAVLAGLDITREIAQLSQAVSRRFGFGISVRVGIHRGLVYLDTAQDDVYGFAANLTARMCSIADPGTVAVSESVERLVRDSFELRAGPPRSVKGVDGPITPYHVVAERDTARAPRGPMMGRQSEMGHLAASWTAAVAGTLTNAGIAFCGEAGIGKSRVARSAIGAAKRSDAVVFELIGSPLHNHVGLYPVRRLLERRCGISRTSSRAERLQLLRAEVEPCSPDPDKTVALLAPVLGMAPATEYDPVHAEGRKLAEQINNAIHDYLIAATEGGPALVLVEDMQWFDPSTIDVVTSLLRTGLGRLLVVMTSRERDPLPDASLAVVFELKPLSDDETAEFVTELYPGIGPTALNTVRRRCGGIPLYIEEVVAKLKEQPVDAAGSAQVPDSLYEALFARLQPSKRALRVVEVAATVGSSFDGALLRSVTGLNDDDLDRVIGELEDSLVLEQVGNDTWRFRHELLREVAAELPPPSIRRTLHSRVADALKSDAAETDPDWPMIAMHLERADRFEEAVSAHRQASSIARRRGALKEATHHLSRALIQLAKVPQSRERDRSEVKLRLRHGFLTAAAEGAGSANAEADFERCLELSGTDPQSDELFATLMALFTYYINRADLRRAEQVVQSLRVGVDGGRAWWLSENLAGSGIVLWMRGEFDSASTHLEEAANLAVSRGRRDLEAEWFMPFDPVVLDLTSVALVRWVRGDQIGADAALTDAKRWGDELGFPQGPFSTCYALYVEALISVEAGSVDRAAGAAAEMISQGSIHGFDQWVAAGTVMQSTVAIATALNVDRIDEQSLSDNLPMLAGWVEAGRFMEAKSFLTTFDGILARALMAAGQPAAAQQRVDAGLQLAQETGMHYYDAELLRLRAVTHTDQESRHADLQAAFDLARTQRAPVFALRAALDDYRFRGDTARSSVFEAMQLFPRNSTWPELMRARAMLG